MYIWNAVSWLLAVAMVAVAAWASISWAAPLIFVAVVVVIAVVAGAILLGRGEWKLRKRARIRVELEARFPDAWVSDLSTGRWLITDRATGRARCELTSDGRATA